MPKTAGTFIQIDGIDGSGKSTLLNAARDWAEARSLKIFDVVEWSKRERVLPTLADIGDADVLLTAEPTHAGIGWVIRNEIIQKDSPYEASYAAQAFALDRGVQYRRIILPFLAARPGRWVIQDRGILSSLAYQPLQYAMDKRGDEVTFDWLLGLQGNRIALKRAPDVFVFLDVDPAIAQHRLEGRTEKVDNHIYDEAGFQVALAEQYKRDDVTAPLRERGTRIEFIDGGRSKEETAQAMRALLDGLATNAA